MINLSETLEQVKKVAVEVGKMQKANLGKQNLAVNTKSTSIDLVTEIDKKSQLMNIDFIKQYYPSHSILAEESGLSARESDYLWIIDPLDGTTNFSQGLPIFAVSIALQYKRETVLGVVYVSVLDHLFTAVKGQGAYFNGQRMKVSAKQDLKESVLATGFPYDVADNEANNLDYFSQLLVKTRAIRRMGAAAYDVACVAAGLFDGYWELKLSPWDVAAAVLMVKEAGGKVIHFREDRGISIIAGNEILVDKIHGEIRKIDDKR
jgi:myo-inositol-1(or 4)-monophosphatase